MPSTFNHTDWLEPMKIPTAASGGISSMSVEIVKNHRSETGAIPPMAERTILPCRICGMNNNHFRLLIADCKNNKTFRLQSAI